MAWRPLPGHASYQFEIVASTASSGALFANDSMLAAERSTLPTNACLHHRKPAKTFQGFTVTTSASRYFTAPNRRKVGSEVGKSFASFTQAQLSQAIGHVDAAADTQDIASSDQKVCYRQGNRGHVTYGYIMRLVSGALSAVVSRTFVAPLERIKLEFVLRKTNKTNFLAVAGDVFEAEGIRGFWHGNMLNILRTAPYKALNYSSYDLYRHVLRQLAQDHQHLNEKAGRFVAGALAGVTALMICFPLDVARTRLLARTAPGPRSISALFAGVVRQEGVAGLYTGCLPALISIAPSGAVFYGVYDLLRDSHLEMLRRRGLLTGDGEEQSLGAQATLLYSALAGAAAESCVYPLEVVRRRLQLNSIQRGLAGSRASSLMVQRVGGSGAGALALQHTTAWHRFIGTAAVILRTEGLRGFYTGFVPNILQVLPNAALSYYTYDLLKRTLHAA